ncbi:hypothetical protein [Maribacter sp. 4U21]|uniref:hypothetical protein n=1 Tax=Maribacter sp. 4U21 TaxID=1889779 RepID=UPI00211EBFBB|nr:hypothetical protein [Maribacter sp. 4U21]
MFFIFRPLSVQTRKTIFKLMRAQTELNANAEKIKTLLTEQGKALKELQELNFVIGNAALFASARNDGSIVFISKKFMHLLNLKEAQLNKPLSELLITDEGQQQYLKEIFKSNRKTILEMRRWH